MKKNHILLILILTLFACNNHSNLADTTSLSSTFFSGAESYINGEIDKEQFKEKYYAMYKELEEKVSRLSPEDEVKYQTIIALQFINKQDVLRKIQQLTSELESTSE
ncbi:hypothetical protein N9933_01800 [bacterium]|nr:hypothetical protein [bacterium]